MKYAIFEDVNRVSTAVNPAQVVTVVKVEDRLTDIVMVGGAVIRVARPFESVVNELSGIPIR